MQFASTTNLPDRAIVTLNPADLWLSAGTYDISFYNPDELGLKYYLGGSGLMYQQENGFVVGASLGFILSGANTPIPSALPLFATGRCAGSACAAQETESNRNGLDNFIVAREGQPRWRSFLFHRIISVTSSSMLFRQWERPASQEGCGPWVPFGALSGQNGHGGRFKKCRLKPKAVAVSGGEVRRHWVRPLYIQKRTCAVHKRCPLSANCGHANEAHTAY